MINKEILNQCNTLSDLARKIYHKDNYWAREKVKDLLFENNIDWKEWLASKKKITYCLYCGKEITGKNKNIKKFCNSSCSASYNNQLRTSKNICLNCGKEISSRSKYCNHQCSSEHKYKEYIKAWQEGKESGMSGSDGISTRIRKYLLEKVNYTCEIPGCECNYINPHTGLSILQIHHIDGDATNNREDNLQVLCPNHHAMTEHFGSRNKNSTRKYRYSKKL